MHLPVMPPVKPMLAKPVREVPEPSAFPGGVLYEPKWDGFRCIVFRDGDEVELGSRNERPLTRYFPEVVAAVRTELPERCVVDGEIVIATGGPWTSRRCCSASIRPSRGWTASPPRRRRRSSRSTCSRSATRT